jgi:hypothetical protein
MPWQLKAEGHSESESSEKKLFRLLGKLFGDSAHGVGGPVIFTGDHIQGNPMSPEDQALASKDTVSEDEEEPEAKLVPKGETYPTTTVDTTVPNAEGEPVPPEAEQKPAVTSDEPKPES